MKNNSKIGTALVTGGAKRIGRDMVLYLAQRGYDIVITYQNSKLEATNLAQEITENFKVNCNIINVDLFDLKDVENLANSMVTNFPNWNLLINNASIFNESEFLQEDNQELSDNFNIHLNAPIILSQYFAKVENQNGNIINMIDKNIARFETKYFYYLLSKKSLADFTKMLSLQLAPKIRVNGIAPGFILNPVNKDIDHETIEKWALKLPLKMKGEIENIIQALDFLLNNKFVTGQILSIDGGASLNHAG